MKSYYEKHREDSEEIVVRRWDAPDYPVHFHANLEIFIVNDGEGSILLDGKRQTLTSGMLAVVESYTPHGYDKAGVGDTCILVVPYCLLGRFYGGKNLSIANPVLTDKALCEKLIKTVDEYLLGDSGEETKRLAVELFLSTLKEKLSFTQKKRATDCTLVRSVLSYIHENYQSPISRKSIAKALGYAEGYISRVFHKFSGVGIAEYVNKLRLSKLERLRKAGDGRKTVELVYEVGFGSQQTYYRVKSKYGEKARKGV